MAGRRQGVMTAYTKHSVISFENVIFEIAWVVRETDRGVRRPAEGSETIEVTRAEQEPHSFGP
jgi:hypothetical protein